MRIIVILEDPGDRVERRTGDGRYDVIEGSDVRGERLRFLVPHEADVEVRDERRKRPSGN